MKKVALVLLSVAVVALVIGAFTLASAGSDSLYGMCYAKNGEKCAKSNHTISTSWNDQKAYPDESGRYQLQFKNSVDKTITVYCDGDSAGSIYVHGGTNFDVHCR